MILEVDCGNTLIKWRVLDGADQLVRCEGSARDEAELLAQLDATDIGSPAKGRIVSVRSDPETHSLITALELRYSMPVELAESSKTLAGVTNGYNDYRLLGTDRWLAIVGAFSLKKSACLVLDIGTAVTADFVDGAGVHLGGFISPGIKMLRDQLGVGTARAAYMPINSSATHTPGQSTAEAVGRGTELMLLGFVGLQQEMAKELWGREFSMLLTGGGADMVGTHFGEADIVSDLVFRGLALACPD